MRNWIEHFELASHVAEWPLITPLGVGYLTVCAAVIGSIVLKYRVRPGVVRARTRHPSRREL